MAERSVKDLLGGGLRPNDPRRFLIEAMIGSMNADGSVDPRELAVLERQIQQHPLFAGMGAHAAKTLVQMANDAIEFAGSAIARTGAIAKGLPSRIHRLSAYGMAAEVAMADEHLHEGEISFLEGLRIALRISPNEASAMVEAARIGRLTPYLDDRFLRIRQLIGVTCEVFALRALARGMANDDHRFAVRDFFGAMPDLMLTADELDAELFRAFRRPRAPNAQVFTELARVVSTLPDPVDRYWIVVYVLAAESPSAAPSWRVIPFMGVMQAAFQITDTDMELAVIDALAFPASTPRPG
jgi:uncharacterized tellurite resistance protein B-like protein